MYLFYYYIFQRKFFPYIHYGKAFLFLALLGFLYTSNTEAQKKLERKPLQISDNNIIEYQPDSLGNRIPDFSYAGYKAGDEIIPDIPVKIVVPLRKGDATYAIQAAINYVASLPLNANGFRGAVLLEKGVHYIHGNINISVSGIVLRGCGMDENGTIILGAGKDRQTLIRIVGDDNLVETASTNISDEYVPVDASSFSVEDASEFKVGDQVMVKRPSTQEWINVLGMADFGGETDWVGWKPGNHDIQWDRTIVSVVGNRVTIDAPITTALDKHYGGGRLTRYNWAGRINNVGVENMVLKSEYDIENLKDEEHRWMAVTIENVKDAWVRKVEFDYFAGSAVAVYETARRVTVEDCKSFNPVSEIAAYRRNTFYVAGTQVLVQRCYAEYGYHDFAVGALAAGPNAFVQCESYLPYNYSGTIDTWASGILFDIVNVEGNAIGFPNRGPLARGAGWTGANSVLWQCTAARMDNPAPPEAMNWSYGAWALYNSNGYWENPNSHVNPRSLYYAQLQNRLGVDITLRALVKPVETNATSSPTVEQAAQLTLFSREPATTLLQWINYASKQNPVSIDSKGINTIDKIGITVPVEVKNDSPMSVNNGWLVRGNRVLTGMRQSVPWWSGSLRTKPLSQAKPAITRYVPGRTGTGYTDDLDEVTNNMVSENLIGMEQNYALWYERRRDDHTRVRRMDGDVWAPFYELPFERSGQDLAWDGLSKYDLAKYNYWYWLRLKQFANLADQKGLVLVHQNYFQHNILEAGAHWVDCPWRTVNNINNTKFPEPPPYAGDKRIFMDEHFYDVTHPVRRELHRAYIRKSLDNFRGNSGVIQLLSEEYTGPLHFVQFWIDVISEWEKETGEDVITGLSVTKDVQDAILADSARAAVVDLIDIRYWAYRTDGTAYAPQGGQHLAPRQHARQVKPGKRSFESVYRAVREYKRAYPNKAVVYSEGQYNTYAWAVFMAGGSLAAIPKIEDPGFQINASTMQPVDALSDGLIVLQNTLGESIIYLEGESYKELDLTLFKSNFKLTKIDSKTGKIIGKPSKIIGGATIEINNSGEGSLIYWISR